MEESVIRRTLPHNTEAEQSVLSSMLMGDEAIQAAAERLNGEDFYRHQYGILFDAMVELYNERKAVDPITLQNKLREKDVPPEISGTDFIKELMNFQATSVNVREYADIVSEKALLRRLIKASEEISGSCYRDDGELDELLDEAEKKMFRLFQTRNQKEFTSIRDIVVETLDRINEASQAKGHITGLPTGFADLDYRTAGLQKSNFVLIAARPAMGKTAFALNIAEYLAFKKKKSVAIFSLEMSKTELVNRMFAMGTRINSMKLRTGNLSDDEWKKIINSSKIIGGSNLMIDDTPGITVREIRSKCRKYKLEHGLDIVFIDYLQLMGSGRNIESRQQEISDISRSLKALARELDVPVVALSQLSRAVEQRADHRPVLADLRESGAIEQDADVVMFIYRDDYYHPESELKGVAEIIIAKQRNGPVGSVNLAWLPDYTKFASLEL